MMGYGTRNGGQIKTFWPDDTENDLYIASDYTSTSLQEIFDLAREKWGEDLSLDEFLQFQIEPERIHTDCITYDLYDAGDYTNFIHITRKEKS
jgi:hypothetical protein